MDLRRLADPFSAADVEWRIQSCGKKGDRIWALVIAYITNRAIQERLDEVCGPENWQNHFSPAPDGGVLCGISIRVEREGSSEWVTKWDGAENTDIEQVKGGLSGAMKRAGVQWGIGRFLYQLGESFAQVHPEGKHRGKTKDGDTFKWDPPALPAWALPSARPASADGEHMAMLSFIREVGARCEEDVEFKINDKVLPIKAYAREQWGALKESPARARLVVEAIEASTGEQFRPNP